MKNTVPMDSEELIRNGSRRTDQDMFDLVEVGCILQVLANTEYAAAFMARKNVPFEVARRVLLRPHQRRSLRSMK